MSNQAQKVMQLWAELDSELCEMARESNEASELLSGREAELETVVAQRDRLLGFLIAGMSDSESNRIVDEMRRAGCAPEKP